MSQLSQNNPTTPNSFLQVTVPLLHDWKLCYGPDIPTFNALKDKVLVYGPNLGDDSNYSLNSINDEAEPPSDHPLQANAASSSSNKRTRIASEESPDQEILGETKDLPTYLENDFDRTPSPSPPPPAVERTKKSRRLLPNLKPVGGSLIPVGRAEKISTAPFASVNRATSSAVQHVNSNRRILPTLKSGYIPTKAPIASANSESESRSLYEGLSEEQKLVYQYIFNENKNVFFSGSAGTGKTVLLRAIISKMKTIYKTGEIAVTASTGLAAANIQGSTIHSFAKVGFGNSSLETYLDKYRKNRNYSANLRRVRVLIVDEISMLDGGLLDMIETICRKVRGLENKPFGGIKVVFVGDFFQLPPVNREGPCRMAFEAKCWDRVVDKVFILKTTFRQRDPEFIKILNEIRHGRLSEKSEKTLQSLSREPHISVGIEPTELYSLVRQVENSNSDKLRQLPGSEYKYVAIDYAASDYNERDLDDFRAPKEVILKENAQVMLIKNLTPTLVNGSVGKIVGFQDVDHVAYPVVHFTNGEKRVMKREEWSKESRGVKVARREQVPLILAYAISIHKSQGQTLQFAKVNLNHSFAQGQVYVALSRATSMETLQVLNFKKSAITVNRKVVDFYKKYEE